MSGLKHYRDIGKWTEEKLGYIGKYSWVYPFIVSGGYSGRGFPRYYYIDTNAGCGMCRLRRSGRVVEGSALRALSSKVPFTEYFFIEIVKKNARALEEWVSEKLESPDINVDPSQVHIIHGDCNVEIKDVLSTIREGDPIFAVIDPEGLEIEWETIHSIAQWRKSEVFVTFPYNMAITRNVGSKMSPEQHEAVTRFLGSGWEKIRDDKEADRISVKEARRRYVDLFIHKMKDSGFKHSSLSNVIKGTSGNPYYYLIFGSHSPKGKEVMDSVLKTRGEQTKLDPLFG